MGRDLAERWPTAASTFKEMDEGLGFRLSELCWEGPENELRLTENTQPALLSHSVAAWRVLREAGFAAEAVAGHSLGEYSAVVAAGGLRAADAARTVKLRGRLMQQAVPVGEGAMAAVLNLSDEAVEEVCRAEREATGEVVVAANFNSPGQVVIAGSTAGVNNACDRAKEAGARRAVLLPVSAPFHSPLMAPARVGLTPTLQELDFKPLEVSLYRNVDASSVRSADDVRNGLIRQIDAPVLWAQTVANLVADGFDTFVEIGAGNVLSGLVRRIHRPAKCYAAGTVAGVEKVLDEIVNV
jgi:[acyl-carrier-protein] S-malonyltransferase